MLGKPSSALGKILTRTLLVSTVAMLRKRETMFLRRSKPHNSVVMVTGLAICYLAASLAILRKATRIGIVILLISIYPISLRRAKKSKLT
jgi:hypothetical protein